MAEELSSRVIPRQVEDEVRTSYLTYAMSVIVSRALPDARARSEERRGGKEGRARWSAYH